MREPGLEDRYELTPVAGEGTGDEGGSEGKREVDAIDGPLTVGDSALRRAPAVGLGR